jgi:hypothetical protein|tara:strand:+ start:2950 stop:3561 length:612 start_codon:yes stop_codon:yes gene_type:complete
MEPEVYTAEVSKMSRPIPGQSLTNDPENPAPYERPPEFTNVHDATMYLWDFVTEEATYTSFMTGISKGVPVMSIVQVVLFNEFQQGKWNPDLMMMLAEPLAYMLIALAERLDLDIIIDNDEEEGDVFGIDMEEKRLADMRESAKNSNLLPQGMITKEMASEMEALPKISLLEQPEAPVQEEAEQEAPALAPEQPSLMAQPEGQ